METLGPNLATASALSQALEKLAIAERVFTRRNGDRWSTEKLNAAKNDVRLAHFHNTFGGAITDELIPLR
jgi:hypothetical protein